MSYLALYNLEETGDPFSVARIVDETLQNSPQCQLPPDQPLDLPLPTIDIELPPLECIFDNIIPITPLPEFCHPQLTGGISVSSCSSDIEVSGGIDVGQVGECDFSVAGDILICPTFCTNWSASSSFTVNITSGNGLEGSGEDLSVEMNPDNCTLVIGGNIDISSTVKCYEALTFSGDVAITSSNPHVTASGTVSLTDEGDCGATLIGSLNIGGTIPCADGPTINFSSSASGSSTTYEIVSGANMEFGLTYDITGGGGASCAHEFTLAITPSISFNGLSTEDLTVCSDGGSSTITVVKVSG